MKTPNEEIQYLGQMLAATDADDFRRILFILKHAAEIATTITRGEPKTELDVMQDSHVTQVRSNLRAASLALDAARHELGIVADALEDGPVRRGVRMARSAIGTMLDEIALKVEPNNTVAELLLYLSLMGVKANDMPAASLAETAGTEPD